jgi:hypothetical protein
MPSKTINRTRDLGQLQMHYVKHLARGGKMFNPTALDNQQERRSFGVNQATYAAPRLGDGQPFMEFDMNQVELIGLRALAMFPSEKKEASFSKVTREGLLRRSDTKRASGAAYNRDDIYTEDDTFLCEEYGFEEKVPDDERALYASDFDAEEIAALTALNRVLIDYEIRCATALMNETTWTGATLATTAGTAWATVATATPITDVIAAKEKSRELTGIEPNSVIMSRAVFNILLRTKEVRDAIAYVAIPTVDVIKAALAGLMGVEQLLVGGCRYNSAKEGQTFSGSDVWGVTSCMVARIATPGAPLRTPCVGRTVIWTADAAENVLTEQYREEQTRSDIIRVRQHQDEKILDASFAHLILID